MGIIEEQNHFFPVLYTGEQPGIDLAALVAGRLRVTFQPHLLRQQHKQIIDTGGGVRERHDPSTKLLDSGEGL
jgi:hypothetical protein